jgi:hypothetical protein
MVDLQNGFPQRHAATNEYSFVENLFKADNQPATMLG